MTAPIITNPAPVHTPGERRAARRGGGTVAPAGALFTVCALATPSQAGSIVAAGLADAVVVGIPLATDWRALATVGALALFLAILGGSGGDDRPDAPVIPEPVLPFDPAPGEPVVPPVEPQPAPVPAPCSLAAMATAAGALWGLAWWRR